MKLQDQIVIVTGGGSGAGAAIVATCVAEGAQVVAMGRDVAKLEAACAAAGEGAHAEAGDVRDRARIKEIVAGTIDRFGRIDILVNNAGVNIADRSLEKLTPQDWDLVMDVNATGAYNTVHEVLPQMRKQGSGLVLAVSSMAGMGPSVLGGVVYSAAKHAMSVLTKMVDLEEAKHGIRSCVISPGEINTPILDQRPVKVSDEHKARMLQPEDIAAAVLFVATLPQRVVIPEMVIKPLGQGSVS
jgi:NADP-dependent 3-hydroxy acid dehydrogenase YdfG|tara:strand:+ start:1815 stop:2543 length:729 start_codon:yes stop_codon:yes gene_type:complete